MSAARFGRGVVVAAAGLALIASSGCGAVSGSHAGQLESFLQADSAVQQASVEQQKSTFSSIAVGHVELKPDADLDAFATRVAQRLGSDAGLKDAQVDIAQGANGYSVLADAAKTNSSKALGAELRERGGAQAVKSFLGDVEVTLAPSGSVEQSFLQLAAQEDVTSVAGDGTIRVTNGTDTLGKKGSQPLDKFFTPAIEAATHAGASSYDAFMDRYAGPSITLTAADPQQLAGITDAVRGVGYWGHLAASAGKVKLENAQLAVSLPAVDLIAPLPSVSSVTLDLQRIRDKSVGMIVDTKVAVVADSTADFATIGSAINDHGAEMADGTFVSYTVDVGQNVAQGGRGSVMGNMRLMQSLAQQRGVVQAQITDAEFIVSLDADHPELWGPACADLRAHPWLGVKTISLVTVRNGKNIDQARFESTPTGVASVKNTGPGSAQNLIDLWNAGAQ